MPLTRLVPARAMAVVQNCHVVRDLDEACARFHALYGIGPFVGGGDNVLDAHVYRGEPQPPIRLRGVFVQSGDLNIELIQLLSTTPSAFHDMFARGDEGLHHVAVFADDYEAEKARYIAQGFALASEFTVPFGAKICYIDARPVLGHMIELYPEHPIIRDMYRKTREAAARWDGRDLIVPWSDFA